MIEKASSEYYPTRVQRLKKSNPAAWYREIRVMTGGKREQPPIAVPWLDSEDSKEIANAINEHFISISRDLDPLNASCLPAFLPSPKPSPTVYPWEVQKALAKVKRNTASGPDRIPSRIIREFSYELATPLTHVINSSFQQNVVPDECKKAIVVPIPKSNPPSVEKLRPVSLTDHFAKITEGFVAKWVINDIEPNLDQMQFGNRKTISTSHCIINILHKVFVNSDKPKSSSTIVVTDFSKAFDRIDHTIAITKLISLGVCPCIVPWIMSFLQSRLQCTHYRSVLSDWSMLQAGVPQ